VDAEELEIARLLLDAGYQLNDVPYRSSWYKFGGTAIKMAAEQGASDIVQLFLDRGADPDIPGTRDLFGNWKRKLHSDTGNVTLSLRIRYGTPST